MRLFAGSADVPPSLCVSDTFAPPPQSTSPWSARDHAARLDVSRSASRAEGARSYTPTAGLQLLLPTPYPRSCSRRRTLAAAVLPSFLRNITLHACSHTFTIGLCRRWWHIIAPCCARGGLRWPPTKLPAHDQASVVGLWLLLYFLASTGISPSLRAATPSPSER